MPRTRKVSQTQHEAALPGKVALRKWLFHLMLPLAIAAALVAGVVVLGRWARDDLRRSGEHTIAFTEIECDPPEGMTRAEFLEEVQYLANLPDRVNLLEQDANALMVAGLSLHPLVAQVKRLEVLPGRRVRAVLVYRMPVLVVARLGRVVDRNAVLLPQSAQKQGLPVLAMRVSPPLGGPGQTWDDDTVKAAAAVAGLLLPHLPTLKLTGCTIEMDRGDLVLRTPQVRIVWGRGPGQERPDEARAEQKVQRLLQRPALEGQEHDLRQAACVQRRMRGTSNQGRETRARP
jgi:hypothetical protein